ncbi:hypothetical protein SAMN04244572_01478 [Azotobacter beijerinckii]|uniref:Uncharacterized protein n=1 Tax=Azotobacter beijerinckii TaxID=170623 RepID=A0A1H9LTB1_9GAMM|nr:hypothetical protein [Azotobacter beijerinckii]SEI73224.1 hypothetical protein SAMN04244572_01478 [Azotobacter beijerinckii]SEJ40348.1 hypothetical protein SAMN04244579_04228 [Azotobacter beijerinckii]SER14701.1 hypothetical protein SAMN04244573_02964 [Azotobacter beijerinckii]
MNKRNRLESFSAREDDLEDFAAEIRQPRQVEPRERASSRLVLQIALGVWLGGLALGLTWYGLSLVLPEMANLQVFLR